jgi:tungstate transport system ATP-binding protein
MYLEHGWVLADLPVDQFFNGPLLQTQYPAAHLFVKGELP